MAKTEEEEYLGYDTYRPRQAARSSLRSAEEHLEWTRKSLEQTRQDLADCLAGKPVRGRRGANAQQLQEFYERNVTSYESQYKHQLIEVADAADRYFGTDPVDDQYFETGVFLKAHREYQRAERRLGSFYGPEIEAAYKKGGYIAATAVLAKVPASRFKQLAQERIASGIKSDEYAAAIKWLKDTADYRKSPNAKLLKEAAQARDAWRAEQAAAEAAEEARIAALKAQPQPVAADDANADDSDNLDAEEYLSPAQVWSQIRPQLRNMVSFDPSGRPTIQLASMTVQLSSQALADAADDD